MGDKIHPTHFQITKDMPWREKEKQALQLLREMLLNWNEMENINTFVTFMRTTEIMNKDLIDWLMKYELG